MMPRSFFYSGEYRDAYSFMVAAPRRVFVLPDPGSLAWGVLPLLKRERPVPAIVRQISRTRLFPFKSSTLFSPTMNLRMLVSSLSGLYSKSSQRTQRSGTFLNLASAMTAPYQSAILKAVCLDQVFHHLGYSLS